MNAYQRTRTIGAGCLAMMLLLVAGSAAAIEYHLTAAPTTLEMPDGASVPAWGYAVTRVVRADETVVLDDPGALAKVPGDPIVVPHDDPVLEVHLTNDLAEPTSLHILGQTLSNAGAPTFVDGRVMSFVHETGPGAAGVLYRWATLKPGTFLLQSATHPAKQVQMGLFAAVVKDASATQAYAGVSADSQRLLVFHDVDPDIQMAIADGNYGTPGSAMPSSVYRKARYSLINGKSYPETALDPVGLGQTVLLRFINAGLENHVPQILNAYLTQVAQDGIPLQYRREIYGFELNAAATADALLDLPAGSDPVEFTIHDAIVANLSNYGTYQGESGGAGGAIVYLAAEVDTDGDGIVDSADNCTLVANADQRDSNGDGFGNICDPDLDNSGLVDIVDFTMLTRVFGSSNADADLDGMNNVDIVDFTILTRYFNGTPGPAGALP